MTLSRRRLIVLSTGIALSMATRASMAANKYRGKDLQKADLSGEQLVGEDFSAADLRDADLSRSNCAQALFKAARMDGANLAFTNLTDADLSNASLVGVTLDGLLRNARFKEANLNAAIIVLAGGRAALAADDDKVDEDVARMRRNIQRQLSDAGVSQDRDSGSITFRGASLRDARIYGNLTGVDFREADLRGAYLKLASNAGDALFGRARYDDQTKWSKNQTPNGVVLAPAQ